MRRLLFGLFAVAALWLTFHLHSKTGYFTYKSEIFSDKAGYYSYLPATFVFGWDGSQVADTLPAAVGRGFTIDGNGHIVTKYPIGVAVLQVPFFLVTHYIVAPMLGYSADGFSPPYHWMIDVAGWMYLLLGLVLMARVLGEYFRSGTVWATLACFFLGTNLCYYYSVESGMSHIYSFFLVAALLRLTQIAWRRGSMAGWWGIALGAVAGLLVVTRFTNAMLLLAVLLWDVKSIAGLKDRLRMLLVPRAIAALVLVPLLLAGLQMGYYFYLTGNPFHYSYGSEGFEFLPQQAVKVWFSPHNGLFPYAPILVFALIGLGMMARRKMLPGWLGIGLFLAGSLVFACWHQWFFGCALGGRSFVELYPMLMVGLAFFVEWLGLRAKPWRLAGWTVLGLLSVIGFKLMYFYPLCYYGQGDWDWSWWWGVVTAL